MTVLANLFPDLLRQLHAVLMALYHAKTGGSKGLEMYNLTSLRGGALLRSHEASAVLNCFQKRSLMSHTK